MNFRKNSEILKIINNDHRSQNKYLSAIIMCHVALYDVK